MLFRWVGYLLVTMALLGCGGVLKSVPFLSPEPIPHGHDYRASSVTPQRYFLDLSLDPAESTFSGEVHIDAVFNEARERIFLHGGDLLISEVVV